MLKNKNSSIFITLHKSQSKWTRNVNIKPEILSLIKENVRNNFEQSGTGGNFLNRTPLAYALRSIIGKLK